MDSPAAGDYQGMLSKKKMDHGRFEDPYRQKYLCWINKNAKDEVLFCIRLIGPDKNPTGPVESIDLASCKLETEDKNKFSILRTGQEQIKLKAESVPEAEDWKRQLQAAISLALVKKEVSKPLPAPKPQAQSAAAAASSAAETSAAGADAKDSKVADKAPAAKSDPPPPAPKPVIEEPPNITVLVQEIQHLPQLDEGGGPTDVYAVAAIGPTQPTYRSPWTRALG
eukprot:CAMPEP_0113665630 /NCGR_PEP_ID=MMETSP0038_2-20120614/2411_1 /TAXON_ID=2898 /ORGANISM="Cryptomonas paramecium" /LENGTH=224 /DNA_ID=CAMNT_0000581003 /DNA_START=72 /DNA_END=742 /DNA_ORIENTATION=+ /assembly_acc=CAM_ASM_000170